MAVLSFQTIVKHSKDVPKGSELIEPFVESNCKAASYDLTVGSEAYIYRSGKAVHIQKLKKKGQSFDVPPGELAFVLTAESLHLPDNISARLSLRLGLTCLGLILGTQPPIDPGYHGHIMCLLHNLGHREVTLERGQHLLTIEFTWLDEGTNRSFSCAASPEKYQDLDSLEQWVTRPMTTEHYRLSQEIRKIRKSYDRIALAALVVVLASVVVPIILFVLARCWK